MSALDRITGLLAKPSIEYRPEVRWWLAEGLHTDETLRYEIDTAHKLGFGGMEFLAMDEELRRDLVRFVFPTLARRKSRDIAQEAVPGALLRAFFRP